MLKISLSLLILASATLVAAPKRGIERERPNSKPERVVEPTYSESWDSIGNYQVPDWFQNAKLGIFVHWGPYSVPAYSSEWYGRLMYMDEKVWNAQGEVQPEGGPLPTNHVYQHHVANYGTLDKFGYKDFIPYFTGELFDPVEWMDLFAASGAKYVVPVAEHHDSFAMYASSITRWNSVAMGPQRDILGELMTVGKERGLKVGASSHLAFNWSYFNKDKDFDTTNEEYKDLYGWNADPLAEVDDEFLELWWSRTKEIIDRYSPDVLWFDFFIDREEFRPYHKKLAAYYYNKGEELKQDVVLQTKNFNDFESFPKGTNVLDLERGNMPGIYDSAWQTDTSIGRNSWGHVEGWKSKSTDEIIDNLVDVVSKNGCLLLNVGPKADGSIPEDQKKVLLELGSWMQINGEAIYGTRNWDVFGEGPTEVGVGHHSEHVNTSLTVNDIRFTKKGDTVYAFIMDWPKDGRLNISSLGVGAEDGKKIRSVRLLGFNGKMAYKQNEDDLLVYFPNQKIGEFAHVLKVRFWKQ